MYHQQKWRQAYHVVDFSFVPNVVHSELEIETRSRTTRDYRADTLSIYPGRGKMFNLIAIKVRRHGTSRGCEGTRTFL